MSNKPTDMTARITEVDVPVYLPNGTITGKARIIEGEGEDAVLIELEAMSPMMASLMKNQLIGISLVTRERSSFYIEVFD